MRASDVDRDRVAEVLRDAAGEGRITLDELGERLDAVYAARTYADLKPLTADLPVGSDRPAVPQARHAAIQPGADQTLELNAKGGQISRSGSWQVPGRVVVRNPYGDTRLDFREATFLTDVVDFQITANWGSVKVFLPQDATADVQVDTSWYGTLDNRVGTVPTPPMPHFRITGNCKGGTLKVMYRTRMDEWLG
ncbi:DUF1707 SHOCT-like domain-containing protein [Nocardiopsis ansamitocini]|nr:DUF1707 domain-containing protein [Nocardiopsis ansamitocini]